MVLRNLLTRTLIAAILGSISVDALAQTQSDNYPSKVIHVICNFPPGNGSDIAVRYFSKQLADISGATVIVENKIGAFGMMGARTVAESKPDGYTIFITGVSTVLSGAKYLYKDVPYNPTKDFLPVSMLFKLPFVMTVDPKLPMKTVSDVTDYIKSGKAKGTYGTAANPGTISAEMYLSRANVKLDRVIYRDAKQTQTELVNGLLDFVFFDAASTAAQVTENRLRAIAVTSAERLPVMPDVPTMAESGLAGYEMILTWGVVVPAKTPDTTVDKLQEWFTKISARPETQEFIKKMGGIPAAGGRKRLSEVLQKEIHDWAEYVRLARIEPQ